MRAHTRLHLRATKTGLAANRRGIIAVLSAILLICMLGMIAFAVDVGYMASIKGQLDRAVDAGALAGAGVLVEGEQEARQTVYDFVRMNRVGTEAVSADDIVIETGVWDPQSRVFQGSLQPSAIRVVAARQRQPLFFARVLGQ